MRGFQGTFGGLGVFTKCAVKLYKWNGPATWGVQGKPPVYLLDRLPERMAFNVHAFPSAQAMKDAGYKLGEAEIEYACFRTPMFFTALGMTENNEQLKVALESGVFHKVMHHVLVNSVIGYSAAEFKWKTAAMKQIMKETGGVRIPMYLKITQGVLRVAGPLLKPLKDPLWPLRRFPFLQYVIHSIPIAKDQKLVQDSRLFCLARHGDGRRVFVDLSRDHSLLTRELLGGVRGFRVDLDGGATGGVRNPLVHRRVPVLALHRELAGASLVLGREHEVLVAPAGPTEGRARLVLVLPTTGEPAAVTPGAPVTLPKGVVAHLRRMLPFYRRRAFYYYFEHASPTRTERSAVDWFRIVDDTR